MTQTATTWGRAAFACLATLSLANASYGGFIISPAAVQSNSLGELNSNFAVTNLINQSGLSSTFTSGVTDFDVYLAGNPSHANPSLPSGGGWASKLDGPTSGTIVFDLGATYTLHRLALWNDIDGQAIRGFSLQISNDLSFSTSAGLGSFNASLDPPPINAQVFDLTDAIGRYVRLNITSTVDMPNNLVQAGEIAFDATPASVNAVPEPASLTLLGVGVFSLLGYRLCRRKDIPAETAAAL